MKKKLFLLPLFGVALSSSLIAGATYALFTSQSKVDVAITAGKVDVKASVSNMITYSGEWDEATSSYISKPTPMNGKFTNGGTASVDENGKVTIDKISPMDKLEFDITVVNDSNVAIKERTGFKNLNDSGLLAGLSLKEDGEPIIAGYTTWEVAEVGSTDIVKHISIEMSELAGNEYQEKNAEIQFVVEAIQGNAKTLNEVVVADQTELSEAIAQADGDTEIKVAASATPYTVPSVTNKTLKIVGENAENTKFKRDTAVGLPGSNVSMSNVTLVGGTSGYVGFQHSSEETYENCIFTGLTFFYASKTTFKNCTFVQETYEYCFWVYGSGTTTFNACVFNTKGKAAKVYNEAESPDLVWNVIFNECEFNSSENTHNKPAVAINSLGATYNVIMSGCTSTNFNCNDDAMTDWYSTRMAGATEAVKCLAGAEGRIDQISVTIDGITY